MTATVRILRARRSCGERLLPQPSALRDAARSRLVNWLSPVFSCRSCQWRPPAHSPALKNATKVGGGVALAASSRIEESVRLTLPSVSGSLRQPAQFVGTLRRNAGIDAEGATNRTASQSLPDHAFSAVLAGGGMPVGRGGEWQSRAPRLLRIAHADRVAAAHATIAPDRMTEAGRGQFGAGEISTRKISKT